MLYWWIWRVLLEASIQSPDMNHWTHWGSACDSFLNANKQIHLLSSQVNTFMLLPVKLLDASVVAVGSTGPVSTQSVLSWGCFGCWLIYRDLAKCWYDNIPSASTKSRAPDLPTASEC